MKKGEMYLDYVEGFPRKETRRGHGYSRSRGAEGHAYRCACAERVRSTGRSGVGTRLIREGGQRRVMSSCGRDPKL